MTKPPIGQVEGKREQVEAMFDTIAPRYDLLNRVLSFGIDRWWRRRAVSFLGARLTAPAPRLLDVATGTADVALAALRLHPREVIGVDLSAGMLALGREKVSQRGHGDRIRLLQSDSADLPFEDDAFDGALVAFGVRNFEDLHAGLSEIRRVLRPSAPLVVLEFSHPQAFPIKQLYNLYAQHVLPRVGRFLSGDSEAYTYLPESVAAFPHGEAFLDELRATGFTDPIARPLTFGIASLYCGKG